MKKLFKNFSLKNLKIQSTLKHKEGDLDKFINMDIHEVKLKEEKAFRIPKKTIGIKTTNFNGMWLDIPGKQFHRSDYHILVKLFLEKDHMFSFFKEISVFKDKLLKRAVDKGYFTKQTADNFFNTIPNLNMIPAYITGFVKSANYDHKYKGKKGRKHYTITSWKGQYKRSFLEQIKKKESIEGDIKFAGINKFSHDDAYIFNTGNLKWSEVDWFSVIKSL